MTKRIFALLLSILMISTLFAACGKKDSSETESIVGAWKNTENGMKLIYIFDNDGTGIAISETEAQNFRWETEGSTLRLKISVLADNTSEELTESISEITYSISDGVLSLSNDLETVNYTKIK